MSEKEQREFAAPVVAKGSHFKGPCPYCHTDNVWTVAGQSQEQALSTNMQLECRHCGQRMSAGVFVGKPEPPQPIQ